MVILVNTEGVFRWGWPKQECEFEHKDIESLRMNDFTDGITRLHDG